MPPPQPPEKEPQSGIPVFWCLICALSCAVTMPFRYGSGRRGGSRDSFFAVAVMVLYGVFVPCPILLSYVCLFIGIGFIKRFNATLRHRCGDREMSGFEGYPLLCLIGLPYAFCKQVVEPTLVSALGWYLRLSNPPLACFLIAGAVAAAFKTMFENLCRFNRDLRVYDQQLSMEYDARQRARRGW